MKIYADRRWVATITRTDGRQYTTILYGSSCSDAERRAEADPQIYRAIVHLEDRS